VRCYRPVNRSQESTHQIGYSTSERRCWSCASAVELHRSIARIGVKFQIHFGSDNCAWLGLRGQHRQRLALEDIQMATKKAVVHPIDPFLFDGPSFQNFVFQLKSSSNAPNHTLTITSQTSVNTNFAFIQGTWQGDGPNAKQITGSITDGTVSLTASWANGIGGTNTLVGRLTPVVSRIPVSPPRWELNGNVVVTNAQGSVVSGGPGAVSGEGSPPQVLES